MYMYIYIYMCINLYIYIYIDRICARPGDAPFNDLGVQAMAGELQIRIYKYMWEETDVDM